MGQLRCDPVGGRWVIVAAERGARPGDSRRGARVPKGGFCPFCEGNEDRTPPEILAYRNDGLPADGPGWRVRVVPNKYPALQSEGDPEQRDYGVYEVRNGIGAHEVFIESPKHVLSPTELPADDLKEVMWAYQDRMRELKNDKRLIYALVFKNVGESGGASVEHTHSQLICTPVMPKRVQEEMANCEEFFKSEGRCLLCEIVAHELRERERVIVESDRFVALAPYASRFPFEMWILPKGHASHFEETPRDALDEFAGVLHEALLRLDASLEQPPYNYLLHTGPLTRAPVDYYHWHVEVIPRVTSVAGFEWGTGFYINPVAPETAAECMRNVVLEEAREHALGRGGAL